MTDLSIHAGRCQFCHRSASEVPKLIAGDSAFICSDCVQSCATLLKPTARPAAPEPAADRYAFQRLYRHFDPAHPQDLVTTSRTFPQRQQADLQLAIDDLFGERRIPDNFLGIHQEYQHSEMGFAHLAVSSRSAVPVAAAQFEEVDIGNGDVVRCLKNGVWLLKDSDRPYAVVLFPKQQFGEPGGVVIEIASEPGEAGAALATRVFNAIEKRLSAGSCYRGRVLSLEQRYAHAGFASRISVHALEPVSRGEVILPEATLRAVERNLLDFAQQRDALRKLGQSTQKGLLFHGAPGTGKTHCIRYISGKLQGHTTLLITAEGVGLLPEYMALARLLQPALVVIEDADLVARQRTERDSACDEVMLNRLLNEMDGLRERADVFFILTTNRPEGLESALVSRPGRIDQAIEFPLPDDALRLRLIALYGKGLALDDSLAAEMARRTDGASPAFIRELMRRIAQHHLEKGGRGAIKRESAESALHEMLFSGGVLNTRLLGGPAAGTRETIQ